MLGVILEEDLGNERLHPKQDEKGHGKGCNEVGVVKSQKMQDEEKACEGCVIRR